MHKHLNRITMGGVLIAFAIIIPQLFHLTGIPQSGQVFLPMHLPVLLSGYVIGPMFGLLVGVISPILSSVFTGMPDLARLPFMVLELATYGFVSGMLYNVFQLNRRKFGIYTSLIISMLAGRIVYAISLLVAANLLAIKSAGPIAAVTATFTGMVGICIQFVIIPPMIYLLEKSGYLNRFFRICPQES